MSTSWPRQMSTSWALGLIWPCSPPDLCIEEDDEQKWIFSRAFLEALKGTEDTTVDDVKKTVRISMKGRPARAGARTVPGGAVKKTIG